MKLLRITFALLTTIGAVQAVYYCQKSLCDGAKHIACHNRGHLAKTCPASTYIHNLIQHIDIILLLHNEIRSLVAGGGLSGYKTATRMATMGWDNELAQLAVLNVKKCKMSHDECRNTEKYRQVGQSVYRKIYEVPIGRINIRELVEGAITDWFDEYKQNTTEFLKAHPRHRINENFSHFTLMVVDRNTRVGCAAAQFERQDLSHFLMTCNYSMDHVRGRPIYDVGKPAAKCRTGQNKDHKNLCSTNERFSRR